MMTSDDFVLGALTLRHRRMDARRQFHIARRLAALLGRAGELGAGLSDLRKGETTEAEALRMAGVLGEALAALPDADADYILDACLDVIEVRQDGGGWAPLRTRGVLMYPVDLAGLMVIAARVIWGNLRDFMAALPAAGQGLGLTPKSPS